MTTMKEAFIFPDLRTVIEDAPIPIPGESDVIVKIVVAGANPIDWKAADEQVAKAIHGNLRAPLHRNSGKDFAGYVHGQSNPPFVICFKLISDQPWEPRFSISSQEIGSSRSIIAAAMLSMALGLLIRLPTFLIM
jgi:hypothetical protein